MTKLTRTARTATILSLLVATFGMACAPSATLASATPASPGFAPRAVAQLSIELPAVEEQVAPEAEPVATELRRVNNKELNPQLVAKASDVQSRLRMLDYGAEESFEMEGKHYVGRLERHYHTPGGEAKPWGWHKGTSLFVEVPAS